MLKKVISIGALSILFAAFLAACGGGEAAKPTTVAKETPMTAATTVAPVSVATEVQVNLTDKGDVFRFKPDTYTFKVNQKVRLVLKSETQYHTFTIKDMTTAEKTQVNVQITGGEQKNYDFTPNKTGSFQLICVPHESLGMVGTVKVEN